MYTKELIGKELEKLLAQPHSIQTIAQWAENLYSNHCKELPDELISVLDQLSMMTLGHEFEYSEEELRLMSQTLKNTHDDPILKIQTMKQKNKNL